MKQRKPPPNWKALPPVPRIAPGTENKQRPFDQRVPPLTAEDAREDSVYQRAELGRISGEMLRADVSGEDLKSELALRFLGAVTFCLG